MIKTWPLRRIYLFSFSLFFSLLLSLSAYSQDENINENSDTNTNSEPFYVDKPYVPLTSQEKKAICQKYKGKNISFAGDDVFFVSQDCKRHKLTLEKTQSLLKESKAIIYVDKRVIEALPHEKKNKLFHKELKLFLKNIKNLEGKCVTSASDVYLIEKGKKRLFPDWVTLKESKCQLKYLTKGELDIIPVGKNLESFIDKSYRGDIENNIPSQLQVDILCKKLKEKIYSYYAQIFILEKTSKSCSLKEIDPKKSSHLISNKKPKELQADEYISLKKKFLSHSQKK